VKPLLAVPLALALYVMLTILGAISLGWCAIAMLLHPLLSRERGKLVGRAGIAHGYAFFWRLAAWSGMLRIESQALDALREERGLIVVANHPSMLDALILIARLPRGACIMKAELQRNVFLGAGARLARYIRNDSPRRLVKLAVQDLRSGGQLVLFPEGTRTTTEPVNRFCPGATTIAKLAGAPIQAVFIETDSPYLRKGWPIWRLPPLPMVYRVRLGRRFAPARDADALLREIEQHFVANLQPAAVRMARAARRDDAVPTP
jgi:1-acyl-sn-glycerol-3-phosphate acyltransferase